MEALNLRLERFEGPMDLLLSLISKHKIDIFDIPIASLADQYMEYLDRMEAFNMEVTSEFIHMASELMLIKSKMLLPQKEDEEDPRKPLVDALIEHQRAKVLAEYLKKQSEIYFDRYPKPPEPSDGLYSREHAVGLLLEAFGRLAERSAVPFKEPPRLFEMIKNERYYTIDEKVFFLIRLMYDGKPRNFMALFDRCGGRGEIVAVFLALLELVRRGRVLLEMKKNDIYLKLNKNDR